MVLEVLQDQQFVELYLQMIVVVSGVERAQVIQIKAVGFEQIHRPIVAGKNDVLLGCGVF